MNPPLDIKELALAAKVRRAMAASNAIREIVFQDMPLWLFRRLDHSRTVRHIFLSQNAALVIYADGGRLLSRIPAQLRVNAA